jgi:hypothetical protein
VARRAIIPLLEEGEEDEEGREEGVEEKGEKEKVQR